jgi:hypothetical protein
MPPSAWFDNPRLDGPSPLEVTDDGRVFGHIATWDSCHIGYPGCLAPPKSASGYAYFRTGVVVADDGEKITVGQVTLGTGHADLRADAKRAAEHYDHTGAAVADVAAGEDEHGIWVAGAVRPTAQERVAELRASAPSGDWRMINGSLELVGVLAVNVPGFPTARGRAMRASGGEMERVALVAAGRPRDVRLTDPPDDATRKVHELYQQLTTFKRLDELHSRL